MLADLAWLRPQDRTVVVQVVSKAELVLVNLPVNQRANPRGSYENLYRPNRSGSRRCRTWDAQRQAGSILRDRHPSAVFGHELELWPVADMPCGRASSDPRP
jgi:hypothetical protein